MWNIANHKRVKLSAFKFTKFSPRQRKLMTWWQNDSPVNDRYMIVADGSIRAGKEQPLSAVIYTPSGKTTMGSITVNNDVFNRHGYPVKVTGVFPQGKKAVYKITFHDGSSALCGKEHLWTYTTQKCIANKNYTMFTSTLSDIMEDLARYKNKPLMNQRAGKYRFPINGCVRFDESEVPVDPYLLGLLLGDGCFTEKNKGISFINSEYELHEYIKNILPIYGMYYWFKDKTDTHCAYGMLYNTRKTRSYLKSCLLDLGLYGMRSYEKFIPDSYKYNSKEIRLNVLAGLLNTDGNSLLDKSSMTFCSTSKRLVDDVAEVARSLGYFVNTSRRPDTRDKNKHTCYELSVRVTNELFEKLSSKHKSRLRLDTSKTKEWKMIKSIEYVGMEECQCIMVDDPEHLYLTQDFVVTHNTISLLTSYLLWAMTSFNEMNFAICARTVGTAKRNLINPMKQIMDTIGMEYVEHRSENYLEIKYGGHTNLFYLFGGRDEASQDQVQGITLAGVFADEVVLFPQSFFNQLLGRTSVEGSKVFCSCNPGSPYHWFKKEFLDRAVEKDILYIHFTMEDNPTLSEEVKNRYKKMYTGVWAKRFVQGLWVASTGLIYDMFNDVTNVIEPEDIPYDSAVHYCIGVDYGTANATAFLLCMMDREGIIYACKEYYFAGRKESEEAGIYDARKTDLEYSQDMKNFIGQNYHLTGRGYRDIPCIVDPSASSFKLQLRRLHFKTKNANNEILDGIRNVASMFYQNKLKISTDCKHLLEEIGTYSWDEKAQERTGRDVVLKEHDHCADALRYSVMNLRRKDSIEKAALNENFS